MLTIEPHPLLDAGIFVATFARPLGDVITPPEILGLLTPGIVTPLSSDDAVRAAVRDLLRVGGYKPTGRGKPSAEYLIRAVNDGALESINVAVDVCNAVSFHAGLPISLVDLDRVVLPLRVGIAERGAAYVFNAGGQVIDVEGLLCLHDAEGPCANGVKDSQRTKTGPDTTRTVSVVWGTNALPGRTARAVAWYRDLLWGLGATTEMVT